MHLNFYFLKQLAQALQVKLKGSSVQAAFSQEKDELVLVFSKDEEEIFLKAIQTNSFTSLQFPAKFHRAKQNSVDLFQSLIGVKVNAVTVHHHERSFYISFSNQKVLLFKLFGNRSNVVLFEQNIVRELFQKKLAKDQELDYRTMNQTFTLNREEFLEQPQQVRKLLPALGEVPWLYLQEQGYLQLEPEQQWKMVQNMLRGLEQPTFFLTKIQQQLRLSLLLLGQVQETFQDPIEALNAFVPQYRAHEYFQKNYAIAHKTLQRQLEGAQKIWMQVQETLENWQHGTPYSQTADVIMANLTNIPTGAKEAELFDFYQNRSRTIKLNATETPQKTAERLYKKAKNQNIELKLLQERAARKEKEVEQLSEQLAHLEKITSAPDLRLYLKKNTIAPTKQAPDLPYHTFEADGFKILVGKNAKANDKLTLRHTHKDDLWLHAKDVPGSHIVIKLQPGKPFPMRVIEIAAQLAAYYSKRKADSLCPVLYTPKKYVRKPKGATPGSVLVEREKVILVKPEHPFRS